jgi:hypothetical protein
VKKSHKIIRALTIYFEEENKNQEETKTNKLKRKEKKVHFRVPVSEGCL